MASPTLGIAIGGNIAEATPTTPDQVQRLIEQAGAARVVFEFFSPKVEITQALMKAANLLAAMGGNAVAKAAHSSGKPSFRVGAGNVPVTIDGGVDLGDVAEKIVAGASFDSGIICSHEQFVLVPEEECGRAIEALLSIGEIWFADGKAIVQRLREAVFSDAHLSKDIVGRIHREICAKAGREVPETARIILIPSRGAGQDNVLAKANLIVEGAGHTATLHSNDENHIRFMGLELSISRLVVNQSSAITSGGSLTNGFAPTTTLGYGSWGGVRSLGSSIISAS